MLKKNLQGFTLLELLVALSIFALVAVMAYGGLDTILKIQSQTGQESTRLARLQMAFTWLRRDIEQIIDRPIRDEYGDKQPSLQGRQIQIEFTRAGWRNPAQQLRSSLQRVTYHIDNNILIRSYWWTLDRVQDARPIKMDLLNDVEELQLRYLDEKLQWHDEWTNKKSILKAIEVELTILGWGRITRIFAVTN